MAREYHIAAVGGSNDDEVSVDQPTPSTLSAHRTGNSKAPSPLKDSDTLLLILSRETPSSFGAAQ